MGTHKSAEYKYNWLMKCFNNAENDKISLSEPKLIAQFCITHASTKRTAKEMIKLFEEAGYIYRIGLELMSEQLFKENRGLADGF